MPPTLELALNEMASSGRFMNAAEHLAQDALWLAKQTLTGKELKEARAAAKALKTTTPEVVRNGIDYDVKIGTHLVEKVPVPYKILAENGAAPWAPLVKWNLPTVKDGKVIPGDWKTAEMKVELNDTSNIPHDRPGLYLTSNPFRWQADIGPSMMKHPALINPATGEPYGLKIFEADLKDENASWNWIYGSNKIQQNFRTLHSRLNREASQDETRQLYDRWLNMEF